MVITSLQYHRNGVAGAGYYVATIRFRGDGQIYRNVTAIVFDRADHVAVFTPDGKTGFRCEDFDVELRAFIASPAGQALAFPHLAA